MSYWRCSTINSKTYEQDASSGIIQLYTITIKIAKVSTLFLFHLSIVKTYLLTRHPPMVLTSGWHSLFTNKTTLYVTVIQIVENGNFQGVNLRKQPSCKQATFKSDPTCTLDSSQMHNINAHWYLWQQFETQEQMSMETAIKHLFDIHTEYVIFFFSSAILLFLFAQSKHINVFVVVVKCWYQKLFFAVLITMQIIPCLQWNEISMIRVIMSLRQTVHTTTLLFLNYLFEALHFIVFLEVLFPS